MRATAAEWNHTDVANDLGASAHDMPNLAYLCGLEGNTLQSADISDLEIEWNQTAMKVDVSENCGAPFLIPACKSLRREIYFLTLILVQRRLGQSAQLNFEEFSSPKARIISHAMYSLGRQVWLNGAGDWHT